MAEKTTAPVESTETAPVEVVEKEKNVNVNVSIPESLYNALYNEHRFAKRLDKGPFGRHVFETYAKSEGLA